MFALELRKTSLEKVVKDRKKYAEFIPGDNAALLQMAQGLEYLHSHKFVHRDVKPGTILISGCGLVKLAYFGFSKLMMHSGVYGLGRIASISRMIFIYFLNFIIYILCASLPLRRGNHSLLCYNQQAI